MDPPIRRPNILHLGGLTLKDYVPIEDVFDEKVLEAVEKGGDRGAGDPRPFERIPPIFTSVEEWPFSTNLCCWSCAFTFDGPPCFIPTFFRHDGGRLEVGVLGNFCTFNCAARYIDDTYPPQADNMKHWRMREHLCRVYSYFNDGPVVAHIKPAPRKTELLSFGGDIDEEEFWERMRDLDPLNGLRDHRPGTVVPERLRPVGLSVWGVCTGVANPEAASAGRSATGFLPLATPGTIARAGAGARRNNIESPRLTCDEMARELAREPDGDEPAAPEPEDAPEPEAAPAPEAAPVPEAAMPEAPAPEQVKFADEDIDALLGDLYDWCRV